MTPFGLLCSFTAWAFIGMWSAFTENGYKFGLAKGTVIYLALEKMARIRFSNWWWFWRGF